jgi:hypothetical protein
VAPYIVGPHIIHRAPHIQNRVCYAHPICVEYPRFVFLVTTAPFIGKFKLKTPTEICCTISCSDAFEQEIASIYERVELLKHTNNTHKSINHLSYKSVYTYAGRSKPRIYERNTLVLAGDPGDEE